MSDDGRAAPVASSWEYRAARAYSWPQFGRGNVVRLQHGAHSPRVVEPAAIEFAEQIIAARPDLEPFGAAVLAYARCEVRLALLTEFCDERGVVDDAGELRSGRWIAALEKQALAHRQALGFDPTSAARLQRERAEASLSVADLGGVVEAGRRAAEGRQRVEGVLALDPVHEHDGVHELDWDDAG